jgi:hypothetical protein
MIQLEENVVAVLGAGGCEVGTITGAAIDTAGYREALVTLAAGQFTSTGTLAVKVQHSDDDGALDAYADVTGAAFTSLTDTTDGSVQIGRLKLDGNNVKRYIKIVAVVGVARAPFGCTVMLYGGQYNPQTVKTATFVK